MENIEIKKNDQLKQWVDVLSRIFLYFLLYSFAGYIYETVLEVFIYRFGFSNRGFMWGPYLPIYGVGAVIILAVFHKWRQKVSVLRIIGSFVGIFVMTTIVELIGSYIMEAVTGSFMWDYSHYMLNFQGRIAPNPSFRFAVGGTLLLYLVHPPYEKILKKYATVFRVVAALLAVAMFIDFLIAML